MSGDIVIQRVDSAITIRNAVPRVIKKTDNAIIIRRNPILVVEASGFGGPEFDTPDNSGWIGII
jgi:hypothetical protein